MTPWIDPDPDAQLRARVLIAFLRRCLVEQLTEPLAPALIDLMISDAAVEMLPNVSHVIEVDGVLLPVRRPRPPELEAA